MPRHRMLGLLLLCLVTPWTVESVNDNNATEVVRPDLYEDNTRKNESPVSTDLNVSLSTTENVTENDETNHTGTIARTFNQPKEELTGFETDVPCDNAQFLMKVLTVIMPLLRGEVPMSTRTSYILYVMKDLLNNSPEAAHDYEIMYKINDLLLTLEKYHDKNLHSGYNTLRQLEVANPNSDSERSKVVFKYELPPLTNPDCTAELLTIIKIVQQAIVRLANNPLCKSRVPLEIPILVDIKKYLDNPKLYSHDNKIDEIPFVPDSEKNTNRLDIFDIGIPKEEIGTDTKPIYTYIPENTNNYDSLPNHRDKQNPHYIYPEYLINKDQLNPTVPPYIIDQLYSSTPSTIDINFPPEQEYIIERPIPPRIIDGPYYPYNIEYDVSNENSGEINLDKIKSYFTSTAKPFDISGEDDSEEFIINPYEQLWLNKKLNPPQFEVTGSPDSAYIKLNQNPDTYVINSLKNPPKNPNEYDSSPQHTPKIIGGLPEQQPQLPYNPYLPYYPSIDKPTKPDSYIGYLPNVPNKKIPAEWLPQLDVSGGGSGEIQFPPTESPISNYDIYFPKQKEVQPEYPYNYYYRPYYPQHEKENQHNLPQYYYPKINKYPRPNVVTPELISPDELYFPRKDNEVIPEFIPKRPPGPQVDNQYTVIPEIIYNNIQEIPDSNEFLPDWDLPVDEDPKIWNPNEIPSKILPHQYPDTKILPIIRDNIYVMEHKIPKQHLNEEMRELIRNLKDLLNLEQVTIEEYIKILNQYQILIEYVKHLNISNAIMKDLLLSMTNLDKLDLPSGKSQVIELTYLIKRPKPLVYQPYYFIKYQLPYVSFLSRLERLLAENPHLKNNPAQLYKALIAISKVAETSPDLEKYDKDDIIRLTFNKGTLVGAKVIKGTDEDMYMTLNKINGLNSDFSIEDVYKLIIKLDKQLKPTSEGYVIENSNIPAFNINTQPGKVRIMKVNKRPILQKITKITTNKIAADDILANILDKANVLRSNESAKQGESKENSNIDNSKESLALVGRSNYDNDLNQFSTDYPLAYNSINYNINTDKNKYLPGDYLKVPNYYPDTNAVKPYGLQTKNTDYLVKLNEMHPDFTSSDNKNIEQVQGNWWDPAITKNTDKPKSYNSKLIGYESVPADTYQNNLYSALDSISEDSTLSQKQLHPIAAAKLLEASLNADKNNNHNEYKPGQYNVESVSDHKSISEVVDKPSKGKSQLVRHSKTYINGIPVKHSKTYLTEEHNDEIEQSYISKEDPMKYNVEHSQSFIDYNPQVANYNYNINPSALQGNVANTLQKSLADSTKYDENNDKTDSYGSLQSTYNSVNNPSQYQDMNVIQHAQSAMNNGNGLAQAYIGGNKYYNGQNYFYNNKLGNLGVKNSLANNILNNRYRYLVHQKLPFFYHLNRTPRLVTRPVLG